MCGGGAKDFLKFQGKTEIRCKPIPGKQKKVTCYKKIWKVLQEKEAQSAINSPFQNITNG